MNKVQSQGIPLKKKFGQHFLRDQSIVDAAIERVDLTHASVFEIGGGDGFLTRSILQASVDRLWVFEIDPDWATYLQTSIDDERLSIKHENILDVDFSIFDSHKPWTLLANLPYQITFPIFHLLYKHRALLKEGVVMVQEEVAQKLVKTRGKGYGFPSLFFNHYFELELLQKILPTAFLPPPKVYSRLIYLKPKTTVPVIPDEPEFWKFIKICFAQPRRTLRNNLMQTHYDMTKISSEILVLRAQQLKMEDFLQIWESIL